jgi:hypothetical protein
MDVDTPPDHASGDRAGAERVARRHPGVIVVASSTLRPLVLQKV